MQDIAGVRVVVDVDRSEQDELVKNVVEVFGYAKVVDRRANPVTGTARCMSLCR